MKISMICQIPKMIQMIMIRITKMRSFNRKRVMPHILEGIKNPKEQRIFTGVRLKEGHYKRNPFSPM